MNSAIVGILMMLGGTGYVYAQDMAPAHFEVTNVNEFLPKQSFWQNILRYIGVRASVQIRPPIGTKITVNSSAYASSPYQTDSTPCINAAGLRVQAGDVATNFLPFGTVLSINGKLHKVHDRMNTRYNGYYLDIWFPSTSEALEFGRKKLEITIVAYGKPGANISPSPSPEVAEKPNKTIWGTLSGLLFTKTYDPNRYDVDCTK